MTALYTRIEDFLCDDDFIRYTLDCDSDRSFYWAQYLNASEHIRNLFLKATEILLHLDDTKLLTPEEKQWLKLRIRSSLRQRL